MLLADGMIGQMMEPLEWHEPRHRELPPKDWAAAGLHGRGSHNIINSLFIDPLACERHNNRLQEKYRLMEQLMANHNIFLSTEDLLVKAWGYDAETDINSVWLYISYLRKRLAAMNSSVRIVSKRNIGYRLENPL